MEALLKGEVRRVTDSGLAKKTEPQSKGIRKGKGKVVSERCKSLYFSRGTLDLGAGPTEGALLWGNKSEIRSACRN